MYNSEIYKKSAPAINNSDETKSRVRALQGEKAFKLAMLNARQLKLESFVIGIDTRPCTVKPTYIDPRHERMSSVSSPAAMCAEFGMGDGV